MYREKLIASIMPRPISSGLQVWCILAIATDASLFVVFQNVFVLGEDDVDLCQPWLRGQSESVTIMLLSFFFCSHTKRTCKTCSPPEPETYPFEKGKSPCKPSFLGFILNFGCFWPWAQDIQVWIVEETREKLQAAGVEAKQHHAWRRS